MAVVTVKMNNGEKSITIPLHETTEKSGERIKIAYWAKKLGKLPLTAPKVDIPRETANNLTNAYWLTVETDLEPINPEEVLREERHYFELINTTKKGTDQWSARKFFRIDEETFLIVNVSIEVPQSESELPSIVCKGTSWRIPTPGSSTGEGSGRKKLIATEDNLEYIFS